MVTHNLQIEVIGVNRHGQIAHDIYREKLQRVALFFFKFCIVIQ